MEKHEENMSKAADRTTSAWKIEEICDALKLLLLYKNEKYGDSALTDGGIFYKGKAEDSILIRMNDKIRRIENSSTLSIDDLADLLGYGVLYMVKTDVKKEDILKYKD